ncbi:MAG: hypothetical protein AUI10_06495 [Actinobacteria bacterium 13_2_20CM_2_72_6]|nr:MAG: hypothetical protein AUI10_06495 [Actinobacteria bacterium 13_2_20CM_2_72_6]OLE25171.1 MAG: hypothetical protein AUG44_16790 [Actinobacteria bacterium 13_1_20CM_3_71_11]
MNPIAFHLAVEATRDQARSALPNAPTVPDPPRPPATVAPPVAALRRGVARGLRWAANRLEPGVA